MDGGGVRYGPLVGWRDGDRPFGFVICTGNSVEPSSNTTDYRYHSIKVQTRPGTEVCENTHTDTRGTKALTQVKRTKTT